MEAEFEARLDAADGIVEEVVVGPEGVVEEKGEAATASAAAAPAAPAVAAKGGKGVEEEDEEESSDDDDDDDEDEEDRKPRSFGKVAMVDGVSDAPEAAAAAAPADAHDVLLRGPPGGATVFASISLTSQVALHSALHVAAGSLASLRRHLLPSAAVKASPPSHSHAQPLPLAAAVSFSPRAVVAMPASLKPLGMRSAGAKPLRSAAVAAGAAARRSGRRGGDSRQVGVDGVALPCLSLAVPVSALEQF
eukprot:TRINITY_DN12691_c0_g1_i1.p1 TRINITY_DN12691_c0_g1~~TRINITY_DN12691_c0_g1_i1.p1  ORF type:complete len:249 (-),score=24.91 TRINITY_DN12691_c0_g1_i1:69-815(-)